jgi:muramidase (phage lysozyme)
MVSAIRLLLLLGAIAALSVYPEVRRISVSALRGTAVRVWHLLRPQDIVATAADLTPEVRALLDTIAYAEGTAGEGGYRTIYSYRYFDSYADHPRRIECAWSSGGWLCSDAAGRYQMLSTTFDYVAEPLGLVDFSPASQDLAAVELIRRCGVLDAIQRGEFDRTLKGIRSEWASLPGAGYGQPERDIEELREVYHRRLGFYQRELERSAALTDG